MNKQEAFDRVVQGVRAQNYAQSWSEYHDGCAYRGDGGTRCHAGHLISDALYEPRMEAKSIAWIIRTYSTELECVLGGLPELFLHGLQRLHDKPQQSLATEVVFNGYGGYRFASPEAYEQALEGFARSWGLNYTPPQAKA